MPNTFKDASYSFQRQVYLYYYGIQYGLVTEQDMTDVRHVTLVKEKTSVDSGGFTPGIYRVNPYLVWRTEMTATSSPVEAKFETWQRMNYLAWSGNWMMSAVEQHRNYVVPAELDALAATALVKAYGNVQKANLGLGEALGEVRETLAMLRSPLSDLREFLSKNNRQNLRKLVKLRNFLKTGRYGGAKQGKRAAKAASNAWLEIRYGFRPLVMLIGDAIEEVRKKEHKHWDPNKIRCARSSATSSSSTSSDVVPVALLYAVLDTTSKEDNTLKAYASVQYRQTKPETTLHKLGLTPRFWPETAWELTRLSFVMDWFVNLGPWIQTLRVKPEVTVLGSTVGKKLDRTVTVTASKFLIGYGTDNDPAAEGNGTFTMKYYEREVGGGPPLLPSFRAGDVIDLFKTIDLLTLAIQRIFK